MHVCALQEVNIDSIRLKGKSKPKILVHKMTVEMGLCAMGVVSGSHWPIRMLQIIAIESNCDARRRQTAVTAAATEQ